VYLGEPDDLSSVAREVMSKEVAGRINDLPTVKELVERIVGEAEEIIRGMPERLV
jgi:hypothetical protein